MPSLTREGGDSRVIEKRTLKSGRHAYRVRWREAGRGSREHVRSFDRHADAVRFETDLRRRRQLGELVETEAGRETLDEWAREWFESYARPNLAGHTLAYYARAWDLHVLPRLGELELWRITPAVVAGFADELRRDGAGDPTIRKVLSLLQGVLSHAVILGKLQANPAAAIRKPAQRRKRAVKPLAPAAVERLRREMPAERDATLVSVLAYAGLRPGEALALTWEHIGERTILVERSLALGELKETKTRSARSVRLLAPLRSDLNALRMLLGRPGDADLVFPRPDGEPWRDTDWRNWRNRVFQPAARRAGLGQIRPYDLRHSFVSLLIAERRTIIEVARQAGHSPTMTLDTYGHVFDELEGAEPVSPEELIRAARAGAESRATQVRPERSVVSSQENKNPAERGF
jgi:integrase